MTILIIATAVLELLAGAGAFLSPTVFPDFKESPSSTHSWIRMYGAAALAAGTFAILTYLSMEPVTIRVFLQTFMIFHLLVGIAAFMGYRKGDFKNPAVAIGHFIFLIATTYFYLA
ncbi:MAG: hypothetical protein AAF696_13850 [Bacteroidota bacterium]